MKSILVDDLSHCMISGESNPEIHHVFFGTANRKKSEKYGLTVPLAARFHREGPNSPHKNRIVDLMLKCWGQSIFEKEIGTREDFRKEFGKSYL